MVGSLAVVALAWPTVADACGGFFRMRQSAERQPSLAYEQTLIIHDAEEEREHFIREVTFRDSSERFGFVVPTPTRPSVEKLKKSPFAELRSRLPYERKPPLARGLGGLGAGFGKGAGGARKVQIIEVKKVGSFTSFVLAATDAEALADWLKKHGLTSTPEADRWLAHYVRMKFYYVAMRYDPPAEGDKKKGAARTKAETIRISFDTPVAYYPYFEPDRPEGQRAGESRMLEIWMVSRTAVVPVVARRTGSSVRWVQPFASGLSYGPSARKDLEAALASDAKLLFKGDVKVQRFMDQKRSRQGFGDVLFVPKDKTAVDEAKRERLRRFAAVLDPSLQGEKK